LVAKQQVIAGVATLRISTFATINSVVAIATQHTIATGTAEQAIIASVTAD
jgi:hypothetical protein